MSKTAHRWVLVVAGTVWLAALGVGFTYLLAYSTGPGVAASAPQEWPRWTRIPRPQGHAVLVMTMHPHCPCTRASVTELNNLMALVREDHVKGYVLAVRPGDLPEAWIKTESYRSAERIPGVEVLIDEDGLEAGGFGAQTSGQVLLYDEHGRLQFAGGITPDRGHVGDSPGRERILSLVKYGRADSHESLVFGCSLGATSCPLPSKHVPSSLN
jgi:hypothetical protein